MSNDEIRELIRIANETGVAELEVQRGDARVVIKRGQPKTQEVVLPAVLPLTVPTGAATPLPAAPVCSLMGKAGCTRPCSGSLAIHASPSSRSCVLTVSIAGSIW